MFLLAVVDGTHIYAYHNKIYKRRGTAEKSLAHFQEQGKLSKYYKVHEISQIQLKKEV